MDDRDGRVDLTGRQLYFLHIPKTAGTSLRSVLEDQFYPDEVCPPTEAVEQYGGNYPPLPWLLRIPAERFARYRLVRGHYFHDLGDRFAAPPAVVTMLRRPLDRSLSFLRHSLRAPAYRDRTIDELVADRHFTRKFLWDFQTKILGHRVDLADPAAVPGDANVPMQPGPKMLERAKAALDAAAFVGLAEEFERSMELLEARFGWPVARARPGLNRSPSRRAARETPSGETLARLREMTQVDEALYAHARAVFERQCGALRVGV